MGSENDDAALLRVLRHALNQAFDALRIDGGKRFVEDPQAGAGQPEARQRHALLLTGGELVNRNIVEAGKPGLLKGLPALGDIIVLMKKAQVFHGGQPGFDSRLMANPQQVLLVAIANAMQRAALPVDFSGISAGQPGKQAQESGFPRTVASGYLHPIARRNAE